MDIDSFLAQNGAGDSSLTLYRRELRLLEKRLGMPLGDATVRAIERLKLELRKQVSGPQRVKILRMFYRAAGRDELVRILKLKQRVRRLSPNDILTLPEVSAILGAATSLRNRALIAVLWETGARAHEVCALGLQDVQEIVSKENGGRKMYTVFFRKTKVAGEEHSSLLIESVGHVRLWLDSIGTQDPEAPLFPSMTGARMTRGTVLKIVKAAARRAGITKRVYSHLFRHSRATHLLRIGVSELNVCKLLGWVPGTPMLRRYSHLVDKDAYRDLLRAHGLEGQETVDVGKLVADGDLRPVVPIVRRPAPAQDQGGDVARLQREVADLRRIMEKIAGDPSALEVVRAALQKQER